MAGFEPWNTDRAQAVIDAFASVEGATLPILHALQEVFGCVPIEAEPLIAARLNISRADVHGVVSFYHDFRRKPPGRHVLRVCRAEACQALGAEAVAAELRRVAGVEWHGTSADGAVTLEPVFCLGLCASGPSALLDGQPVGGLTPERAGKMVRGLS